MISTIPKREIPKKDNYETEILKLDNSEKEKQKPDNSEKGTTEKGEVWKRTF